MKRIAYKLKQPVVLTSEAFIHELQKHWPNVNTRWNAGPTIHVNPGTGEHDLGTIPVVECNRAQYDWDTGVAVATSVECLAKDSKKIIAAVRKSNVHLPEMHAVGIGRIVEPVQLGRFLEEFEGINRRRLRGSDWRDIPFGMKRGGKHFGFEKDSINIMIGGETIARLPIKEFHQGVVMKKSLIKPASFVHVARTVTHLPGTPEEIANSISRALQRALTR